ncbi:MAG: hypothetical protein HUJ30_03585 [Gammaproteobacteria bacterium]|nr:hypothetical protein [Gammaproteobacteria bacterium]
MSLNQLYMRFLLITLVAGPLAWVIITDDGQRFADTLFLKLGGAPEVQLNYKNLSSRVSMQSLKQGMPELEFQCARQRTDFGDSICHAKIASINGAPARYLSAFFVADRLSAMRFGYQRIYHQFLYQQTVNALGMPRVADNSAQSEGGMVMWQAGDGLLYMFSENLPPKKEPVGIWLTRSLD